MHGLDLGQRFVVVGADVLQHRQRLVQLVEQVFVGPLFFVQRGHLVEAGAERAARFVEQLREAFDLARKSVAQWEDEDAKKDASVERSEPQIATSPSIEAKLARWSATLPQAPAVEFKPVAPALND